MVLTERGIGDAIQEFIEKDEKDAIVELINYQIDRMQVSKHPVHIDIDFYFYFLFLLHFTFIIFKSETS
jgi:hypothetical protein